MHEYLHGTALCYPFISISVIYGIAEQELSCGGILISGFKPDTMAVTQDTLVIAIDIDDRNDNILSIEVEILEPVFFTECLSTVFEIADEVSMPDNTQRISLAELHLHFERM